MQTTIRSASIGSARPLISGIFGNELCPHHSGHVDVMRTSSKPARIRTAFPQRRCQSLESGDEEVTFSGLDTMSLVRLRILQAVRIDNGERLPLFWPRKEYRTATMKWNGMQTIFVTGTDTNVGKTYVSCLLIRKLRAASLTVGAYKPACSGAEFDADGRPFWSDIEALRAAAGAELSLDVICPQRFLAAVAPNVAAEMEGSTVSSDLLLNGFAAWGKKVDALIVEGAGGVFCPLSNELTVLDLATQIQAPVIVVAANRLGVISHTRLTVDRLRQSGLEVAAVILNEAQTRDSADSSLTTNATQLSWWIPDVAVLHVAFQGQAITILHHRQALANPLLNRIVETT